MDVIAGLQQEIDILDAKVERLQALLLECANVFEQRLAYHSEPTNPRINVATALASRIRDELFGLT